MIRRSRSAWYPEPSVRKLLGSLESLVRREVCWRGGCHHCDGAGWLQRERYGFSLRWVDVPLVVTAIPCTICDGNGTYTAIGVSSVDRPRSNTSYYGRWRDPETGIVHARMLRNKSRKGGGIRPTCGVLGMRARLTWADFDFTSRVTCLECAAVIERRLLRDAGVPPLVARAELLCDSFPAFSSLNARL